MKIYCLVKKIDTCKCSRVMVGHRRLYKSKVEPHYLCTWRFHSAESICGTDLKRKKCHKRLVVSYQLSLTWCPGIEREEVCQHSALAPARQGDRVRVASELSHGLWWQSINRIIFTSLSSTCWIQSRARPTSERPRFPGRYLVSSERNPRRPVLKWAFTEHLNSHYWGWTCTQA